MAHSFNLRIQELRELKASLGYVKRPSQKKEKEKEKTLGASKIPSDQEFPPLLPGL